MLCLQTRNEHRYWMTSRKHSLAVKRAMSSRNLTENSMGRSQECCIGGDTKLQSDSAIRC